MATSNNGTSLLNLRIMFYLATPNETSYEKLEDVPNYVDEAIPYFLVMIFIEGVVLKLKGKEHQRINDGISSISHGLISQLTGLVSKSIELTIYVFIYERFCLVSLPWDNPWTWILGLILTDFIYYWFHRFSHESNIVWAAHQVHHSSEEYNLTTALRQSLMQKYYSMILNLPMALCIPPSIFYVHLQFNVLYQFWIHTEIIDSLGPLEYILNTPSHHRVHHGRNPYCIDKNYGGTLIIWDRIFNTFEAENEKVVYGLVHTNQFWSPIYGQFYHYLYIFGLVKKYEGVSDKVSAIIKGPGWEPGKPWRGLYEDLPPVEQPVRKYNSRLPAWATAYVCFHFLLAIACYNYMVPLKKEMSYVSILLCIAYFIYAVSVFGALFDNKKYSPLMEFLRCALFLVAHYCYNGQFSFEFSLALLMNTIFLLSGILWGVLALSKYDLQAVSKKTQ